MFLLWLLLCVAFGYAGTVALIVLVGTVTCALLGWHMPKDTDQARVFGGIRVGVGQRCYMWWVESVWQMLAFALQVVHSLGLLPPPRLVDGGRPVLLLPGYLENAGTLWLIGRRLARLGYAPQLLDYPSSALPIETNAAWLAKQVERVRAARGGEPVLLLAHSMSGLVARTVLLSGPDHGVAALCAVCSPFRGTHMARLGVRLLGLGGSVRDMTYGSSYLARYPARLTCDVPVLSVIGAQENVVSPEWSSVISGADNRVLTRPHGHVSPLFDREVFRLVERWLRSHVAGPPDEA